MEKRKVMLKTFKRLSPQILIINKNCPKTDWRLV